MLLRLNRESPTPLYHQIVQAIRWRIGTGELRAGDPLPAVRDASLRWGVNYHTVRRAYQELAQLGWIETVQGAGTTVAFAPPPDAAATMRRRCASESNRSLVRRVAPRMALRILC